MKTQKSLVKLLLISAMMLTFSCKKEGSKSKTTNSKLQAKVICEDCYWSVIKGTKTMVSKARAAYNETYEFDAKVGDTILMFGYNYGVTKDMDGYLYKNGTELNHGVTHCGGNPSFFTQYIVK